MREHAPGLGDQSAGQGAAGERRCRACARRAPPPGDGAVRADVHRAGSPPPPAPPPPRRRSRRAATATGCRRRSGGTSAAAAGRVRSASSDREIGGRRSPGSTRRRRARRAAAVGRAPGDASASRSTGAGGRARAHAASGQLVAPAGPQAERLAQRPRCRSGRGAGTGRGAGRRGYADHGRREQAEQQRVRRDESMIVGIACRRPRSAEQRVPRARRVRGARPVVEPEQAGQHLVAVDRGAACGGERRSSRTSSGWRELVRPRERRRGRPSRVARRGRRPGAAASTGAVRRARRRFEPAGRRPWVELGRRIEGGAARRAPSRSRSAASAAHRARRRATRAGAGRGGAGDARSCRERRDPQVLLERGRSGGPNVSATGPGPSTVPTARASSPIAVIGRLCSSTRWPSSSIATRRPAAAERAAAVRARAGRGRGRVRRAAAGRARRRRLRAVGRGVRVRLMPSTWPLTRRSGPPARRPRPGGRCGR